MMTCVNYSFKRDITVNHLSFWCTLKHRFFLCGFFVLCRCLNVRPKERRFLKLVTKKDIKWNRAALKRMRMEEQNYRNCWPKQRLSFLTLLMLRRRKYRMRRNKKRCGDSRCYLYVNLNRFLLFFLLAWIGFILNHCHHALSGMTYIPQESICQ